jgi:hypothetical protein
VVRGSRLAGVVEAVIVGGSGLGEEDSRLTGDGEAGNGGGGAQAAASATIINIDSVLTVCMNSLWYKLSPSCAHTFQHIPTGFTIPNGFIGKADGGCVQVCGFGTGKGVIPFGVPNQSGFFQGNALVSAAL